jgi:hypothetical protein
VRWRWVRPYLRYYLRLVEDARCSVPENGDVSFERLSTLLRQGIEGGFEDVDLVEVGSIIARIFTLLDCLTCLK